MDSSSSSQTELDVPRSRPAARSGRSSKPDPARYQGLIQPSQVDPDAAKVLRRLSRHGHAAYLVGGGVRDLLLGRSPKDFDIATSARPNDVRTLFRNCRVIGRRFRLAHVMFSGGKVIEVATFRRDPRDAHGSRPGLLEVSDGEGTRLVPRRRTLDEDADLLIRHDNVFGDPHEDAVRRDFTINGLFYDLERDEVIDYVGGVRDLQRRLVRTIGDADIRFREDPIRILRAVKFSARLDLGLEPCLYDAIVDLRDELERAAPPRTFEELLRLLRGGAAQRSIYMLWDTGLLSVVLPELGAYLDDDPKGADLLWPRLAGIDELAAREQLPSDTVLLSLLIRGPAEEFMEGERDTGGAFDSFFEDIGGRFSVPRRIREGVRNVLMVQRRLHTGKIGNLVRREFFRDAAAVYAIECRARGGEPPDWTHDPSLLPSGSGRASRRRRKRNP